MTKENSECVLGCVFAWICGVNALYSNEYECTVHVNISMVAANASWKACFGTVSLLYLDLLSIGILKAVVL